MEIAARYRSLVADNARWEGFEFRDDDIIISTPPKCGTTWTQMICALLIFGTPDFDRPLDVISPWLEQTVRTRESVFADLGAQTHRRFIKSHTPFDGLPYDERVTYVAVGRDPRDVAVSMAHHFDNMDFERFIALIDAGTGLANLADVLPTEVPVQPADMIDRFWLWVEGDSMPGQSISGLPFTLQHLQTFWDERDRPNVILLHYQDLQDDIHGEMKGLAARLGIERANIPALARAASFDEMRSRAVEVAPNATEPIWRDAEAFFHKGTSGQWRDLLGDDDLHRYDALVADLVPPDFSAWLHRGAIL